MDEYIGDAIVENPTYNAWLAKYQLRQTQGKQNSGLKIIPRRWVQNVCGTAATLIFSQPPSNLDSGSEMLLEA